MGNSRLYQSWAGRGPHTGHTITGIEAWAPRIEPQPNGRYLLTSGRVRCTCGVEWDTCVDPPGDAFAATDVALTAATP